MSVYSPIITVAVVASLVTGVKALWELSQLALPKSRPKAVEHNSSKHRSRKRRRRTRKSSNHLDRVGDNDRRRSRRSRDTSLVPAS
jgi:hypothetical protein